MPFVSGQLTGGRFWSVCLLYPNTQEQIKVLKKKRFLNAFCFYGQAGRTILNGFGKPGTVEDLEKRIKSWAQLPKRDGEHQFQRIGAIMKAIFTKGRLFMAAAGIMMLVAVFLAGARHGYHLGFTEGEKRTNGWWIDKKARYYESDEVRKKRINLKFNHI